MKLQCGRVDWAMLLMVAIAITALVAMMAGTAGWMLGSWWAGLGTAVYVYGLVWGWLTAERSPLRNLLWRTWGWPLRLVLLGIARLCPAGRVVPKPRPMLDLPQQQEEEETHL